MRNKKLNKQKGFTLIELLVVISIISLLSSIILSGFNRIRDQAKITRALTDQKMLAAGSYAFIYDTGKWPSGCPLNSNLNIYGGFGVLITRPVPGTGVVACPWSNLDAANWNGPYITSVPEDPWGNPYFFVKNFNQDGIIGQGEIMSPGPNGSIGNSADNPRIILKP